MYMVKKNENAYFVASNSAKGFFSYYPLCFDRERIGRVFAIKGGPGTGKSYFMRAVAKAGEGDGWRVDYIYCSSDPHSLDGIILKKDGEKDIALLDATAPHQYEPSRPGTREEIVNLGAFWNSERLRAQGDTIEALCRQKSDAYRQAYRFLSAVGDMERTHDELVAPHVRRTAIEKYAERLMRQIDDGTGYEVETALIHSVGMYGRISFDTYLSSASHILRIEDCHGSAQYLMQALGECAVRKNLSIRVSHDPISPEKIDGLFLCESGVAIVILDESACEYPHRTVSMRRFVDVSQLQKIRPSLNYASRMKRAMLDGAIERLEKVRRVHFSLERIYISAMDFEEKEKYTKRFCERLFDLKNE